jgi:hypothetical protein
MQTWYLIYRGEVVATAGSRDEAEKLKSMYQMDYGPEIDVTRNIEEFSDNSDFDSYDDYSEDEDEVLYDEW